MAGRPPGAKNKRTLEIEAIIARYELNPFEVLMMISAGDWRGLGYSAVSRIVHVDGNPVEMDNIPIGIRCQAAKEATQYIFPKKKILELEITKEQAIQVLENEFNNGGIQDAPEGKGKLKKGADF